MSNYNPPSSLNTNTRIEPDSPAIDNPPKSPYNNVVIHTQAGHSIECDDTPGQERIRVSHGGTNSAPGVGGPYIEMTANTGVIKITGDGYDITLKDKNLIVGGQLNVVVQGDCYLQVEGDKIETIKGNYEQHILGNFSSTVEGAVKINAIKGMDLLSGNYFSVKSAGTSYFNSNMRVKGLLTAEQIVSNGRVDAATGISAGPLGFISELGGLSIGLPAAVPFQINCSGPINSATSVSTPLTMSGVTNSVFGFDVVNLLLHNTHIHPTPKGPTGPPTPQEAGE